jgi:hypothetical protein
LHRFHVVLALHPRQQGRRLLPYLPLLLSAVGPLLLVSLLAELILVLNVNVNAVLFFLLFEVVDVDVYVGHPVLRVGRVAVELVMILKLSLPVAHGFCSIYRAGLLL